MNAAARLPITSGKPAPTPLRRDLPLINIDGTIKFLPVLRRARAERKIRREIEERAGYLTFCLIRRIDRVRSFMDQVREHIAQQRAFWSVTNVPRHRYENVRREYFGHVWYEPVYVGPIDRTASQSGAAR